MILLAFKGIPTVLILAYNQVNFVVTEQGEASPGYPASLSLKLKDSVQVIDPLKGSILEGHMTVMITPIHLLIFKRAIQSD